MIEIEDGSPLFLSFLKISSTPVSKFPEKITCGNGYSSSFKFALIRNSFFGDINCPVLLCLNPFATCLNNDIPLFFLELIIVVSKNIGEPSLKKYMSVCIQVISIFMVFSSTSGYDPPFFIFLLISGLKYIILSFRFSRIQLMYSELEEFSEGRVRSILKNVVHIFNSSAEFTKGVPVSK